MLSPSAISNQAFTRSKDQGPRAKGQEPRDELRRKTCIHCCIACPSLVHRLLPSLAWLLHRTWYIGNRLPDTRGQGVLHRQGVTKSNQKKPPRKKNKDRKKKYRGWVEGGTREFGGKRRGRERVKKKGGEGGREGGKYEKKKVKWKN